MDKRNLPTGTVRATIYFPEDILEEIKIQSIRLKIPTSTLVTNVMDIYLKKFRKEQE